jgi:hypothetical protein
LNKTKQAEGTSEAQLESSFERLVRELEEAMYDADDFVSVRQHEAQITESREKNGTAL